MNQASNIERVLAGATIAAGTAAVSVVAYFNPVTTGFFPRCPFNQVTGLNCPGCGLTRGFHALFHGDVLGALHFNLLIPVYIFVFAYLALALILIAVKGRRLSFGIFQPKYVYVFLIAALVFGVVRNLPFFPFSLLAI